MLNRYFSIIGRHRPAQVLLALSTIMLYFSVYFANYFPSGKIFIYLQLFVLGSLHYLGFERNDNLNRQVRCQSAKKCLLINFESIFFSILWLTSVGMTIIVLFIPSKYLDFQGQVLSSLLMVNNLYQQISMEVNLVFDQLSHPFAHLWYFSVIFQCIFLIEIFKWLTSSRHKHFFIQIKKLSYLSMLFLISVFILNFSSLQLLANNFLIYTSFFAGFAWSHIQDKVKRKLSTVRNFEIYLEVLMGIIFISTIFLSMFSIHTQWKTLLMGYILMMLLGIIGSIKSTEKKVFNNPLWDYLSARALWFYLWGPTIYYGLSYLFYPRMKDYFIVIGLSSLLLLFFTELSYYLFDSMKISLPIGQSFKLKKTIYQFKYFIVYPKSLVKEKIMTVFMIFFWSISFFTILLSPQTHSEELKILKQQLTENKQLIEESKLHNKRMVINHIEGVEPEVLLHANALEISIIGDTHIYSSAHELKKIFPNAVIESGRNNLLTTDLAKLKDLNKNFLIKDHVVIMYGVTGPFSLSQMEEWLSLIGTNKSVYLVIPGSQSLWSDYVDITLNSLRKKYDHVYTIDWRSEINSNPSIIIKDLYLNQSGSEKLAKTIAREIYRNK